MVGTAPEVLAGRSRQRKLHNLGIFCGISAALWLAGAEAPTKLVTVSVSPLIISFMMVAGAFISRWSLPALIRGTRDTFTDTRRVPHLIVWGVMAGCLWAVGNTLTIFAVRDIGLSLAFPLWNSNSLIGILWGILPVGASLLAIFAVAFLPDRRRIGEPIAFPTPTAEPVYREAK